MARPDCPNCGTPATTGEFCAGCGQLNRNARLQAGELAQQALDQLVEWRSPWLRTLLELFWQPGRVALDYALGKRARYVNPVKYCLIVVAAVSAAMILLGQDRAAADAGRAAIVDLPANVKALVAIPFEVLLLRLAFHKHERSATEIAVLCLFATAQTVLVAQVVAIGIEQAFRRAGDAAGVAIALALVVTIGAYLAVGIAQFFRVGYLRASLAAFAVGLGTACFVAMVETVLRFGR